MTPANYRRHVNKRRERPLMPSVAGSLRGLQPVPGMQMLRSAA
jgi:hypothetical protein